MKIIKETTDYKEYLEIKKGIIYDENSNTTYERYSVNRPKGVGALVYNEDIQKFILIKQFRYPVYRDLQIDMLEIPAGVVEDGDSEITTLNRELIEEIGYCINVSKTKKLGTFYMSGGITNDRISLYLCIVDNSNKIGIGGGLDIENENIEIYHLSKQRLIEMIKEGEIIDGKTAMAITYYLSKVFEYGKSDIAVMGRV